MEKRSVLALASLLWAVSDASALVARGTAQEDPRNPGAAEPMPPPASRPETGVPELVIAGRVVLRLRSQAGGLSAGERAFSLRQRLGPILTLPDLRAEDVTVQQRRSGQTAYIYVRDRLLITVDRNLAKANETSIDGLASHWARNLRTALPQVNVTVRMSGYVPPESAPEAKRQSQARIGDGP
jgi:hypothetical protein